MSTTNHKPFILIDGSSYLFRAYHALPPLTNAQGMPTGAIYGVLNMVRKLLKEYQPTHIAVVFDSKEKNFRHALYSAYKANRAVMPDELQVQIQPLFAVIHALGLPLLVIDGVETDDVIGTLAHQANQAGIPVLISTGDKDFAQLVNDNLTLINTMSQQILDESGVVKKFGVSPHQMIDYLALMGDTSDNIPGVPKVGPKTAANWLAKYQSLDNLLAHADEISGKVGENLRQHAEQVLLGKKLITIRLDVPLEKTPDQLTVAEPDNATLKTLFTELEFKNWLADLSNHEPEAVPAQAIKNDYDIILDEESFLKWIGYLKKANRFALDTETSSLDAMRAQIVGLSLATQAGKAAYIPLAHDYDDAPTQLDKTWVLQQLSSILNDPKKEIVGQNIKYDLKILKHEGVTITARLWDTLLADYVLMGSSTRHNLDAMALKYLSYETVTFEEVAGKGAKQLTFNQVPLDKAGFYAAEDADITLRLADILVEKMNQEPDLKAVLDDIDLPLIPILADMEYYGVLIDTQKLNQQSELLKTKIEALEKEAYALSGEIYNLGSSKQLQQILYEKLKLPILKKTPKGQASTAENVLQELALDYPLPKIILEYRSLSKLKSTYTDRLPEQVNPRTGRVHTSYQQAVTATGRLSSTDPNLQNIPIRSEEGRKIRQAFIAPEGYKIVAADYSQVELRIMAHLSKDPGLLAAFAKEQDVHCSTAAEVFGVELSAVTSEQRRRAKAINFGLMYGMSSYGLSKQLGISREEAQEHMDVYFSRYPKVHEYMLFARQLAAEKGYAQTLYGRRIPLPDILASQQQRRSAAERQAINAPLQGTVADIIKLAMICIDQWLASSDLSVRMIMQVHDELIFEVQETVIDEASQHIRHCMQDVVKLDVPLIVDIGVGENWDEAH